MDNNAKGNTLEVLLFSDNVHNRQAVKDAAGLSLGDGFAPISWVECATADMVRKEFKPGRFAALVLDAEAQPEGGPAVVRSLRDLTDNVPPVLMLIARDQDEWLARWARSSITVKAPFDPFEVEEALRQVLR